MKFDFNTKTVLITGGAGSIGSRIVKKALFEGAEKVIACDVDEIRLFELAKQINDKRLVISIMDVKDPKSIYRTFDLAHKIDVIFHAAAMKHVPVCEENPIEAALTNIIGTQNVVDAALSWHVPTSVLISTDKAVSPKNVMGASKFIAEKIFLKAAQNHASQVFFAVRFGNVANSRGSVIPVFIESLLQKNEINITDPEVTRFIMRIEDAVALIFKSLDLSVGGEIFVLKMPAFRLGDLANILLAELPMRQGGMPKAKAKIVGLAKGEKKHEALFDTEEMEQVKDLGSFYGLINEEKFSNHEKYNKYSSAKNLPSSSDEADKISYDELRAIVFENEVIIAIQKATPIHLLNIENRVRRTGV